MITSPPSRFRAPLAAALFFGWLAATPATAQAVDAAALFKKDCAMCHQDPHGGGEAARIGPALNGITGNKAATQPGYTRYSKALAASGKVWTDSALDAYLAAPMTAVPGTTMALVAQTSPAERAALIAYLKQR